MKIAPLLMLIILATVSCSEGPPALNLEHQPDQPEIFGASSISTGLYERDMAISPSGNEIIYTLGNYRQTKRCLVSITKTGTTWQEKKILPFSGRYNDIEPFFAPGGDQLFFASDRPLGDSTRSDYNIWVATRTSHSWTQPVALDTIINTPGHEFYPAVGHSGNLYFTATRDDGIGREDIFVSRWVDGSYELPQVLDTTINTSFFEFNATINAEENLIIFSSYGRSDDLGGGDLYASMKEKNGNWKDAVHLGPNINSDKLDYCPFIDEARSNFYFTSEKEDLINAKFQSVDEFVTYANSPINGMGNIFRVNMKEVLRLLDD